MTRTAGFTAQDVMDVMHARHGWQKAWLDVHHLTLMTIEMLREMGLLQPVEQQYERGDYARYYNASLH